jgi:intraflagellar transport protein 88
MSLPRIPIVQVCFNLANAYHLSKMYAEALNTYSVIVKNKQYASSGRLRVRRCGGLRSIARCNILQSLFGHLAFVLPTLQVNMGNIHYEEKQYTQAIKMYRIALDQIPGTSRELRLKIQRNIGNAFVRLGQFQDAITAFESIMEATPEIQAGFNLVVCYYALGDVDLMKRGFQRLLQVQLPDGEAAEEERPDPDDDADDSKILDMSRDVLKEELKARQKAAVASIANAAKLIAPTIDPSNWINGYDWVIEQLKVDHALVASELQICKALQFLQAKEFDRAIEEFKAFERKDTYLKTRAATNLSFLYFLEGDMAQVRMA